MIEQEEEFIDEQPTTKTNGTRNRGAGHSWEREVVNTYKAIFPNIGTTRNNSRVRDAEKIDVMNTDEAKFGRLPYNFQCKTLAKHVDYTKLLSEMPQGGPEINVVLHRKTKKVGTKFMVQGKYAILDAKDFYEMVQRIEHLQDNQGIYRE